MAQVIGAVAALITATGLLVYENGLYLSCIGLILASLSALLGARISPTIAVTMALICVVWSPDLYRLAGSENPLWLVVCASIFCFLLLVAPIALIMVKNTMGNEWRKILRKEPLI